MANISDPTFGLSSATLDSTHPNDPLNPTRHPKHAGDTPWPALSTANDLPPTTIFLRPVATPAALGLASYASATFVVAAYLAGWYGDGASVARVWPFVLTFGGFGGIAAGMWSFHARDTTGSVVHTLWGALWLAVSLYWGMTAAAADVAIDRWGYIENFAIWMVPVAAFTWASAITLMYRELVVASIYGLAATGATLAIIGWFVPSKVVLYIAAYVWMLSSLVSLYRVWVFFMHEAARDDKFLPIFRTHLGRSIANHRWTDPAREAGVYRD